SGVWMSFLFAFEIIFGGPEERGVLIDPSAYLANKFKKMRRQVDSDGWLLGLRDFRKAGRGGANRTIVHKQRRRGVFQFAQSIGVEVKEMGCFFRAKGLLNDFAGRVNIFSGRFKEIEQSIARGRETLLEMNDGLAVVEEEWISIPIFKPNSPHAG